MKKIYSYFLIRLNYFMKPNCLYLRHCRSKFKNGYYKILTGLAENILGSALLRHRQILKVPNQIRYLRPCLRLESVLAVHKRSVNYFL
jgi:hypothetical protein